MFPFAPRLRDWKQLLSNSDCWGCEMFRHFLKPQCQAYCELIHAWKRLGIWRFSNHGLKTKNFTKRTVSLRASRPRLCFFLITYILISVFHMSIKAADTWNYFHFSEEKIPLSQKFYLPLSFAVLKIEPHVCF